MTTISQSDNIDTRAYAPETLSFTLDGTNKLCYEQPADWLYNTQLTKTRQRQVLIEPLPASAFKIGAKIRTWIKIHASVIQYMKLNGGHIVVVPVAQTDNHLCRSKENWPIWKYGYGVIVTGNEGIAHTEVWTGVAHITCSQDNNYSRTACDTNQTHRAVMPDHTGWFTVGVELQRTSHAIFTILAWIAKTGQEASDKLSFIRTAVKTNYFQTTGAVRQAVGIAQIPITLTHKFQWLKNQFKH